jgi:hypothetical protein
LLSNDGRSVNTGFHNGVFTGGCQCLIFIFPSVGAEGAELLHVQGGFSLQQASHVFLLGRQQMAA